MVAVVCIVMAGIVLAYVSREYVSLIHASRVRLEQTTGELLEIQVEPRRQGRTFHLRVRYRYSFDGQSFVSDRIGFGPTKWRSMTESRANSILEQLQQQDPLTVYVESGAPSKAVLIRDTTGVIGVPVLLLTAVGCVFALVGLGASAAAFQEWQACRRDR